MTKPTLPAFLNRTPEQVEADDRAQEARRASFTRAKLNDGERLLSRGAQLEEIAHANLSHMEERRKQGFNKRAWGGATLDMVEEQQTVLAHALELQGRFLEAAEVAPLKTEQKRLREIHEAVERDDALCACPRKAHKVGGAEIEISPRRALKTIYSRRHGGEVALMKCETCGLLNARPLTGQAAEIAGARVKGPADGRGARPDVQVLRKR